MHPIAGLSEPNVNLFILHLCWCLFTFRFQDFVREDAVLVAVQFWLLSISFFSVSIMRMNLYSCFTHSVYLKVIYESIPHLWVVYIFLIYHLVAYTHFFSLSVLFARVLLTKYVLSTNVSIESFYTIFHSWAAFTLFRTGCIQRYIQRLLIDADSPCQVDLFPTYFKTRISLEASILLWNSFPNMLMTIIIGRREDTESRPQFCWIASLYFLFVQALEGEISLFNSHHCTLH